MVEAIMGLVGVIIGALIGMVTTHMQNKNSVNLFLMEKRTNTYLTVIDNYLKATRAMDTDSAKDIFDKFQALTPELLLYGSDDVREQTEKVKKLMLKWRYDSANTKEYNASDVIKESTAFAILVDIMRNELKIE